MSRSRHGRRGGPHLVDPRGLWVADLNGAARSHEVVPGAHVISLSRVGDRPQQPHWRRFYLVDSADPDDNIALDEVLDDVMTTVTACIEAGEPVVVHCFAGESRTGLVLRGVAHAARWADRSGGHRGSDGALAPSEDVEQRVHRSTSAPRGFRYGALSARGEGFVAEWYYIESGQTRGPVDDEAIRVLASVGGSRPRHS